MGLKKETADMCWTIIADDREGNEYSVEYMSIGQGEYQMMHPNWYIPAWSLHRLMSLLMIGDKLGCITHNIHQNNISTYYELVIASIEHLIKIDEFNKEYLE